MKKGANADITAGISKTTPLENKYAIILYLTMPFMLLCLNVSLVTRDCLYDQPLFKCFYVFCIILHKCP